MHKSDVGTSCQVPVIEKAHMAVKASRKHSGSGSTNAGNGWTSLADRGRNCIESVLVVCCALKLYYRHSMHRYVPGHMISASASSGRVLMLKIAELVPKHPGRHKKAQKAEASSSSSGAAGNKQAAKKAGKKKK